MKSELAYRISAAIVMSGFMSTALSGVFTWLEFGLSLKWLVNWSYAITIAWPVAAGLDLVFGAGLRRFSTKLVESTSRQPNFEFRCAAQHEKQKKRGATPLFGPETKSPGKAASTSVVSPDYYAN